MTKADRVGCLMQRGECDFVLNVEDAEGLAAHQDGPSPYRLGKDMEAVSTKERKLYQRAAHFGCSLELVRYIETLERRWGIIICAENSPGGPDTA